MEPSTRPTVLDSPSDKQCDISENTGIVAVTTDDTTEQQEEENEDERISLFESTLLHEGYLLFHIADLIDDSSLLSLATCNSRVYSLSKRVLAHRKQQLQRYLMQPRADGATRTYFLVLRNWKESQRIPRYGSLDHDEYERKQFESACEVCLWRHLHAGDFVWVWRDKKERTDGSQPTYEELARGASVYEAGKPYRYDATRPQWPALKFILRYDEDWRFPCTFYNFDFFGNNNGQHSVYVSPVLLRSSNEKHLDIPAGVMKNVHPLTMLGSHGDSNEGLKVEDEVKVGETI